MYTPLARPRRECARFGARARVVPWADEATALQDAPVRSAPRWATPAALLGITALAWVRVLLLGETFALRDHPSYTLPSRSYLADSLRHGRFPEWWDGVGLGIPFASNPGHGATYPPAWLVALFPDGVGADVLLFVHVYWLALGGAALARRLGASSAGAILSGGLLATSGYVASMPINAVPIIALAWTPWICWGVDHIARASGRARVRAAGVTAVLLALQWMSGEPASMLTTALLAWAWLLVRAERRGPASLALACALLAAALLAAATLLPTLLLLGQSQRAGGIPYRLATAWSLHPVRLLELVWPDVLGPPGDAGRSIAPLVAGEANGTDLPASWSLSEHLGLPLLALAVIAALRRRDARWLGAIALGFVALALGRHTPLYPAYRWLFVPERVIRYPEKHACAAVVIAAVLAGVGLTEVIDRGPRISSRVWRAVALGAVALVFAAGLLWLARAPFAAAMARRAAAQHRVVAADGAVAAAVRGGLLAGLWAGVFAALLARTARDAAVWPRVLLVVVPLGHALWLGWELQPMLPRGELTRAPAVLATLATARPGRAPYRIFRPTTLPVLAPADDPAATALALRETALDNSAAPFGFDHFPGYDPALSARLRGFWTAAAERGSGRRMLDLFGVELALFPSADPAMPAMTALAMTRGHEAVLYRNDGRRPRAFVAVRWEVTRGSADAIARTLAARLDPGAIRVDAARSGSGQSATDDLTPCAARYERPERVVLQCHAPAAGWAVLLDAWEPGWTARVDGRDAAVALADGLVRAVAVDAGDRRIELTYRAPGLRTGAAVAALAWLLCALGAIALRERRALNPHDSRPESRAGVGR